MIYLVSNQLNLFDTTEYKKLSIQESLDMISKWNCIQYDSETSGRSPHLNKLLCIQFGNKKADTQIVVDCTTVDVKLYKSILENGHLIGHNLKFDLQFLYNYNIIPRNVYDTMIVEQLLYLGYPPKGKFGGIGYSLADVSKRRLDIDIDKSVRGEIIWRGLDTKVILYAANDVVYLEDIMWSQIQDCKLKACLVGAKLECDCVPAVAYMEWCGIKLDERKWNAKMRADSEQLLIREDALNKFIIKNKLSKYYTRDNQGDLFTGFSNADVVTINWDSPDQVVSLAKDLGFNTIVQDKKTGEDKDSVIEKNLRNQKGINDEFLELYFAYKEASKVVSSFGKGHLNSINPVTHRLHTQFKQLGAASGRFSCGGGFDDELAAYKHLPAKSCIFANLQQLPNDAVTRGCFVAPEGYKFVSCDYSAEEARLGGDIYQDEAILDMFRRGLDSHSVYAKIFFKEQLKDIDVHDVKKKASHWRSLAKGPEFALNFGGGAHAIKQAIGCTDDEAETILKNYEEGFKGTIEFAKKGSKAVRNLGYVLINPITGHKLYWWDILNWKHKESQYKEPGFWDEYKAIHKPAKDVVYEEVKLHMKAGSKWDRMARNAPCQGTGSIIMKTALTNLFNWIVNNGYFGIIHLCVAVHDEINCDYPEQLTDFPNVLKTIMEEAASKFCKSLPIPAEAAVNDYWEH